MLYEIFEHVVKDDEITMERMSFGTIEEKYVDKLSKYLVNECGYNEDEPGKFSLRVVDEEYDDDGKLVLHDWTRYIEIEKATEMGFIKPDNFNLIELPVNDPWSNIDTNSYHEASKGYWIANTYDEK